MWIFGVQSVFSTKVNTGPKDKTQRFLHQQVANSIRADRGSGHREPVPLWRMEMLPVDPAPHQPTCRLKPLKCHSLSWRRKTKNGKEFATRSAGIRIHYSQSCFMIFMISVIADKFTLVGQWIFLENVFLHCSHVFFVSFYEGHFVTHSGKNVLPRLQRFQ